MLAPADVPQEHAAIDHIELGDERADALAEHLLIGLQAGLIVRPLEDEEIVIGK